MHKNKLRGNVFSRVIPGRSVMIVPRHDCYYDLRGQRGPRNALPQSMSCRRLWLAAIQPSFSPPQSNLLPVIPLRLQLGDLVL